MKLIRNEATAKASEFLQAYFPKLAEKRRAEVTRALAQAFFDVSEDSYLDGHLDGYDEGRADGFDQGAGSMDDDE
jgi:hypothetical protein